MLEWKIVGERRQENIYLSRRRKSKIMIIRNLIELNMTHFVMLVLKRKIEGKMEAKNLNRTYWKQIMLVSVLNGKHGELAIQ